MKYIVDRIENNIVVLETDEGKIEVEISLLPEDVKEGSVLVKYNGRYIFDEQSTDMRRQRLFLLQESLKNKK